MKFYIVSRRKDTTLLPHKEKKAQAEIIVYIFVSKIIRDDLTSSLFNISKSTSHTS